MIDFIFGRSAGQPGFGSSFPQWIGGMRTSSGERVNNETAYNYSAVWCATRIIAETAAMLPLLEYKTLDDGGRARASDRPEYALLKDSPNPEMGSMAFREGRTAQQVNWGNGFAEIVRLGGRPAALWPIHPSRVRADKDRAGEMIYKVRNDAGQDTEIAPEDMLHIPGVLSDDGIWGRGVIPYGRESIGFGLATERHGAEFFSGGAMPAAVVALEGLQDKGTRDEARREWKTVYGKAGEVAFLPKDSEVKVLSIPNEAAQFLETRQFNVAEIARWYNLPPHMVKDLTRATFSNIEQQSLDFVIYSLLPWLRRWEEQLNLKLIPAAERRRFYFEHNVGGLLRGDLKSRYEAYQIALDRGFMTINEVRRLENLNPIGPAGDQHFVQMNMTTAERMLSGDPAPGQTKNSEQLFDQWTRAAVRQGKEARDAEIYKLNNRLASLEAGLKALPAPAKAEAIRPVVLDAVARMLGKESNAAMRAIAKPEDEFSAWLGEFYGKHRGTIAEALAPSAASLAALGLSIDARRIASAWAIESESLLSRLYNTATKDEFAAAVSAWPTKRAETITNGILSGDGNA